MYSLAVSSAHPHAPDAKTHDSQFSNEPDKLQNETLYDVSFAKSPMLLCGCDCVGLVTAWKNIVIGIAGWCQTGNAYAMRKVR